MGRRRDPDRWDLPPPLLGECREGNIPISVTCPVCGRNWQVDVMTIEGDDSMPVEAYGSRLTCECGRRGGIGASPERRPWIQWLRKTGQRSRLPYTAAFVREDEPSLAPGDSGDDPAK